MYEAGAKSAAHNPKWAASMAKFGFQVYEKQDWVSPVYNPEPKKDHFTLTYGKSRVLPPRSSRGTPSHRT